MLNSLTSDIILGMDWLEEMDPIISFKHKSLKIKSMGKWHHIPSSEWNKPPKTKYISRNKI